MVGNRVEGGERRSRYLVVGLASFIFAGVVSKGLIDHGLTPTESQLLSSSFPNIFAKTSLASKGAVPPTNPQLAYENNPQYVINPQTGAPQEYARAGPPQQFPVPQQSYSYPPQSYSNTPAQGYAYAATAPGGYNAYAPGYPGAVPGFAQFQPAVPPPPPPPPHCDDSTCSSAFDSAKEEIDNLGDSLVKSQALCIALQKRFSCRCDVCGPKDEDKAGRELQTQFCAPEVVVQLKSAGGACQGFESFFCATPFGDEFCSRRSFSPAVGSPDWMKHNQVVDPGSESGKAGLNLFQSQLPQYLRTAALTFGNFMNYGTSAAEDDARLSSKIADEIEAFEPNHDDHERQKALFNTTVTVAEAKRYAASLKEMQDKLEAAGVELPSSVNRDLDDLELAANNYNSAGRSIPQLGLSAIFAALVLALAFRV